MCLLRSKIIWDFLFKDIKCLWYKVLENALYATNPYSVTISSLFGEIINYLAYLPVQCLCDFITICIKIIYKPHLQHSLSGVQLCLHLVSEALIKGPLGFLANFQAFQHVLWSVSVSLPWQGFPDVGISAELSGMWWNPQSSRCLYNYWEWFTSMGHERDEVDALDGETKWDMGTVDRDERSAWKTQLGIDLRDNAWCRYKGQRVV